MIRTCPASGTSPPIRCWGPAPICWYCVMVAMRPMRRRVRLTRLHTNFKLNAQGEYLALFDQLGQFVDGLPDGYPPQVLFYYCCSNPPTQPYLVS